MIQHAPVCAHREARFHHLLVDSCIAGFARRHAALAQVVSLLSKIFGTHRPAHFPPPPTF